MIENCILLNASEGYKEAKNGWIQAASFLWQNEISWLAKPRIDEIPDDNVELKKKVQSFAVKDEKRGSMISLMFLKFSDWMQIKVQNAANRLVRNGHLTVEEIRQAEKCILWQVQRKMK